jgi:hypothetical protein
MKRRKPAPRSLFRTPEPVQLNADDPQFVAKLKQQFSAMPKSDSEALERNLTVIESLATRARTDLEIERGSQLADDVMMKLRLLRHEVQNSGAHRTAVLAIQVVDAYWRLRADALFARDVRAAETRHKNLEGRQRKTVTDEQIAQAVANAPTKTAAAARLGITPRQLRERLRVLVRD